MQTENAKQDSGLKKVSLWALATIAAWVITKIFDSYYDVSLFGSLFAAVGTGVASVGSWLGQTVPMQLWLFGVVTASTALATTFGIWTLLDKRLEIGVAKEEQGKAYAKAREVIAKLEIVSAELDGTKLELKAVRKDLDTAGLELSAAYAKIAELQIPALPPLTEEQDKVIAAIAAYDSYGEDCSTKEFPSRIGLTLLQADGAMDVLEARKLISLQYYNSGRYVTLTAKGRAYVLHPDFDMPLHISTVQSD